MADDPTGHPASESEDADDNTDRHRFGTYWDGRGLEEWLCAVSTTPESKREGLQDWSFPTSEMADEYLVTIGRRTEKEVQRLLRFFLFDATTFGEDRLHEAILAKSDPDARRRLLSIPYYQRILRSAITKEAVHPSIRWPLDLLPHWPREAIAAINAYHLAHGQTLPDGRYAGLSDAVAIIRARYIGFPETSEERRLSLFTLSPREFEHLVECLYDAMGYRTILTPPSNDGGRDVIAERSGAGLRDHIRIECKLHSRPTGAIYANVLLGVVSREKVNKGVLVSGSWFTRGARRIADENPRLELVNGRELVVLLNQYLGHLWPSRVDQFIAESQKRMKSAR
jgi:restriction system protein